MRVRWVLLSGVAPAVFLVGSTSWGSETTIYVYDTLGRLVTTTRTGGPNDNVAMATCFDRAGNRSAYFVGTTAAPACPAVSPTPAPAPAPSLPLTGSTGWRPPISMAARSF
jgi:YD repeat-containing protein